MPNPSQAIEALLRTVHAVEYSLPGDQISLIVKYADDDQEYFGRPPPRDNPFTASGLRDPALGNSGPINFSDIEWVAVECKPRHQVQSVEYQAKFQELSQRLRLVPGVCVAPDRITAPRGGER